jgi:protein-disulfide isomerase
MQNTHTNNHNHTNHTHGKDKKIFNKKEIFSFRNTIIGIILLLIAFITFWKVSTIQKESEPVKVVLNSDENRLGNLNAKVTIIEYADFQCPACKAFEGIVSPVITDPNYTNKVNFIFKYFPLTQIHKNAMLASLSAQAAANQGKFWEMKKKLYENQDEWKEALDSKSKINSYAKEIGLNMEKFDADVLDKNTEDRVMRDLKEATSLRLGGTPTFIINGVKVSTGLISTPEKLKDYIDKEYSK